MTWKRVGIPKRKMVAKEQKKGNIQDEGWAWVVMLASCFSVAMSFAFANTFGIFYTSMTEELGFELTSVTLIGSIHTAIALGGGWYICYIVQ